MLTYNPQHVIIPSEAKLPAARAIIKAEAARRGVSIQMFFSPDRFVNAPGHNVYEARLAAAKHMFYETNYSQSRIARALLLDASTICYHAKKWNRKQPRKPANVSPDVQGEAQAEA